MATPVSDEPRTAPFPAALAPTAPLRAVGARGTALRPAAVGAAAGPVGIRVPVAPLPAPPPASPDGRATVAATVALLCLAAVLWEAAADLFGDDPVFWVVTPLRLAVLLGLAAVAAAGARHLRTPFDAAVALLLVAAAVSTALAGQPWAPWRGVLTSVGVFYLTVGVRRVVPGSWPALALLALVGVAVAGTSAVRQVANETATGFCRGALDGSADLCTGTEMIRATGTFTNPNLLAAFLVLLLPLAAASASGLADRASRRVGAAAVVVGYAAVLLTASRGGIVAAVAGVAAYVVLRRPTRRRLLLAGAATAAAVGVAAIVAGSRLGVRGDVWAAAVGLVVDDPFGVGPGRAGALIDAAIDGDEAFAHAHNLWLNWAVEAGVAGVVAALVLTATAAVVTVRATARGSAAAAAAGAGLAGFAVMSLADHPAGAARISIVLWAVLALVAAEARPRRVQPPEGNRSVGVPAGDRSRSGSR